MDGVDLLISRHGPNHDISPTNVPYKENMIKMKDAGITHIFSITACGSLRERLDPGTIVLPDQVIDRTYKRENTIFEDKVIHTPMAEPFSKDMRRWVDESLCRKNKEAFFLKYQVGGVLIVIEGLRFSTKAESNLYRSWGCDIINMTTMPEATFAKELGMEYQPIALVTDYDCWKEGEEVTFEKVREQLRLNREKTLKLMKVVLENKNIL
jgi:5'-methylthioadenosine phosphorylase